MKWYTKRTKCIGVIMNNCIFKLRQNKIQKKKEHKRILIVNKYEVFFFQKDNDFSEKYCSK
jgi:hypothetical protein